MEYYCPDKQSNLHDRSCIKQKSALVGQCSWSLEYGVKLRPDEWKLKQNVT